MAVVHSYYHIGCAKVANPFREVQLNTYDEFTKKKLNYPIITCGRSSKNLDSYRSISTNIIKWKSDHSVQQVFERKLITCILERLSGARTYQEFSIPVHLSTALARAKKLAKSIEIRAKSFLRKSVSACGSCERCANQKFVWWLCHQTHQSAQGPEIECKKNQEEDEPELLCRYSLRSDRENAIADLCARLLRKALKEDTIPLDSREKGVVV